MTPFSPGTIRRIVGVAAFLASITVGAGACGVDTFDVRDASSSVAAEYSFVIPEGAGLALDAGTPLEVLPGRLDATVGETIQIVNEDDRGHLVGPWFVGAGETLRQTFTSPGEFIGECTVHPSGEIRVIIS